MVGCNARGVTCYTPSRLCFVTSDPLPANIWLIRAQGAAFKSSKIMPCVLGEFVRMTQHAHGMGDGWYEGLRPLSRLC